MAYDTREQFRRVPANVSVGQFIYAGYGHMDFVVRGVARGVPSWASVAWRGVAQGGQACGRGRGWAFGGSVARQVLGGAGACMIGTQACAAARVCARACARACAPGHPKSWRPPFPLLVQWDRNRKHADEMVDVMLRYAPGTY
jgi:hypothetical protein